MRVSRRTWVVLRLGAVMCALGAVVMAVAAISIDSSPPSGQDLVLVENTSPRIRLPDPGLFPAEVVIYGATNEPVVPAEDLGCDLVTPSGLQEKSALVSHLSLSVLNRPPVTVDGTRLQPLFAIDSYPNGSAVRCTDAASAAPLAFTQPSTFGGNASLVRWTAATGAVLALAVAAVGWFCFRPSSPT